MINQPKLLPLTIPQVNDPNEIFPKTQFDEFGNVWKTLRNGSRIKVERNTPKQIAQQKFDCYLTSINYLPNKAIWRAKKDQVIRNYIYSDKISKCFSEYDLIHDDCCDTRIHILTMHIPLIPHDFKLPTPVAPVVIDIEDVPDRIVIDIEEDPIEPEFFDNDFQFISAGNNKFF